MVLLRSFQFQKDRVLLPESILPFMEYLPGYAFLHAVFYLMAGKKEKIPFLQVVFKIKQTNFSDLVTQSLKEVQACWCWKIGCFDYVFSVDTDTGTLHSISWYCTFLLFMQKQLCMVGFSPRWTWYRFILFFICPICSSFSLVFRGTRHYLGLRFAKVQGIKGCMRFSIYYWLFRPSSIGRGARHRYMINRSFVLLLSWIVVNIKVGKLRMKSTSLAFEFIHLASGCVKSHVGMKNKPYTKFGVSHSLMSLW